MNKIDALKKINKCLALSKSSEPHEAAAALRQAQKLMQEHGLSEMDIVAAEIAEQWVKCSSKKTPPRWEVDLSWIVAAAFGCDIVFSRRLAASKLSIDSGYSFVGPVNAISVAAYSYEVLRRKIGKARAEYVKTKLKRHKTNKVAAADAFCLGWISALRGVISQHEETDAQRLAKEAYKRVNYGQMSALKTSERKVKSASTVDHRLNGREEGKKARLHKGLASEKQNHLALGA